MTVPRGANEGGGPSRGTRRGKRSRERRLLREALRDRPDGARVVATFHDGWTMVQLRTSDDLERHGALMRNCVDAIGRYHREFGDYHGLRLPDDGHVYELRDPDGVPHASVVHCPHDGSTYSQGRAGATLKPEYGARLRAWLSALPYQAHGVWSSFGCVCVRRALGEPLPGLPRFARGTGGQPRRPHAGF